MSRSPGCSIQWSKVTVDLIIPSRTFDPSDYLLILEHFLVGFLDYIFLVFRNRLLGPVSLHFGVHLGLGHIYCRQMSSHILDFHLLVRVAGPGLRRGDCGGGGCRYAKRGGKFPIRATQMQREEANFPLEQPKPPQIADKNLKSYIVFSRLALPPQSSVWGTSCLRRSNLSFGS